MSLSNTTKKRIPSLRKQRRDSPKTVPNSTYGKAVILTLVGFLIAIVFNIAVPQIAEAVELDDYVLGGYLILTMNDLYRIVLGVLVAIYAISAIYNAFDEKRRFHYVQRAPFRFVCGIALALWDVLGTKLQALPQPFFPGPAGILESFLIEGDFIWQNTLYSLRLFAVGFLLGVAFGVTTGILIGWFPKVYYWLTPVLNICGVIPAVAWMPFALTLFPTPFAAAAFLIVICCWFPVASMTAEGIQSTSRAQLEAAKTLGGNTFYQVFHVAVPHAMPQIFGGIGTANAFAFTTLVMAEMMGQPGGLGYYINLSKVWSAYYKVFAAIIVMAILFSLIMKIIDIIRARVLRWQRGILK